MVRPLTESPKRFLELDALRGIAIFTVLLFHYTTRYDTSFGFTDEILIHLPHAYGLHLLFILSGFVIYMSILKTKSVKLFIISRIARILPVYYISVLSTFLVLCLSPLPNVTVSINQALLNLTMLPHLFNTPRIDGVYWALYVEVAFYIIAALVLFFQKTDQMNLICSVWLSLIIIRFLLESIITLRFPGTGFLTLNHGQLFVAGIMFYKIHMNRQNIFPHIMILLCLIAQWAVLGTEKAFTMMVCNLLFYLFIYGKLRFIVLKPLLFLGSISYSLFLIHQNIGFVIINRLEAVDCSPIFSIIIASTTTIILSAICTYRIEKPAAKFILKYGNK